jgi:hypothetical protein
MKLRIYIDTSYRLEKCNSPIFAHSIGLTFLTIGILPRQLLDSFILHFGIRCIFSHTFNLFLSINSRE